MPKTPPVPESAPPNPSSSAQPIAIIGMGCRYPGGSDSPGQYWDLLRRGGFAVTEIPRERWDIQAVPQESVPAGKAVPRWGGFLDQPFPHSFDAAFFDIPAREAQAMDPQQRLLLEVAWRACEDAGLAPDVDAGRAVGVFVGISTTDYHGTTLWHGDLARVDAFTATGASFAAAAGRLSYVFGFDGPCLAIDTACSSSLAAVHQACQSLRQGECEAALVAGVNALLAPNLYACLGNMGLMAGDGRCKAFDASGDGYVRAEGAGALVLKLLDDARRDGDHIHAVIRGSAVNQDGRSNGLTAPSRQSQEKVISRALESAGLSYHDIDYVEAHGTGTPLGDIIELSALSTTYAAGRGADTPLWVGSAKTNIGHLEAGAGMAGLIKAVMAVGHGEIPAHLHLTNPTPDMDWDNVAIRVPGVLTPWPHDGRTRPRRAAVSAFGFAGTNGHVIVEQAPPPVGQDAMRHPDPVLIPLSARTPEALAQLSLDLADWLDRQPAAVPLINLSLTLGAGRVAFSHRRVVVAASAAELAARLRGQPVPSETPVHVQAQLRTKLDELGAQWVAGQAVDWDRLYRSAGAVKTGLPGHPLYPQRHWPHPASAPVSGQADACPQPCAADTPAADLARQHWQGQTLDHLLAHIDHLARQTRGLDPRQPLDPDQPLLNQGFTSLMALALRKSLGAELGVPLSATFFFNYPSIRAMAVHLHGELNRPPQPAPMAVATKTPMAVTPVFDLPDDLSAQDLASLIDRELELL